MNYPDVSLRAADNGRVQQSSTQVGLCLTKSEAAITWITFKLRQAEPDLT